MKHEITTKELYALQVGKTAEVKIVESYVHRKPSEDADSESTEVKLNIQVTNLPQKESIIAGMELSIDTLRMELRIKGETEIQLKEDWEIKHSVFTEFMEISIFPRLLSSLLMAMNVQASLIGQRIPFEPRYIDLQQSIKEMDPDETLTYI